LGSSQLRPLRRNLQIVFQDPMASLDPRMTVEQIVTEPLSVHSPGESRASLREAALESLQQVGLPEAMLARYPHQLSGGQAQRVGIARAMILRPRVLVCDEAVSALDVTTQAQILSLIATLRREHGLTLLFISHNLAAVRQVCDRVLVLYLGRMMEMAPARDLYAQPAHPYSKSLLDAIPIPDPLVQPGRLMQAPQGDVPSAANPPAGCVFHTRCAFSIDLCRIERPRWERAGEGREVACHRWREWPGEAR
jgi:oligopeptide transport system ATP-binding protein